MSPSLADQFTLEDKVAIVTGAGKGIGAGIAVAFATAGADIAICARTQADLERVAGAIEASGRRAYLEVVDVMDMDALGAFADNAAAALGGINVVVNNAGGSVAKPFVDTTVEDLEWSFRFNVSTAFELTRRALPHLLANDGGTVVNISSVAGRKAVRGSLSYSCSKAAMSQLTRLMAMDLAPRVRVNAVLPGAIETPALANFIEHLPPGNAQLMLDRTMMRRHGRVEDIAAAALYLASDASSWVTGKLLEVDGLAADELVERNLPDL